MGWDLEGKGKMKMVNSREVLVTKRSRMKVNYCSSLSSSGREETHQGELCRREESKEARIKECQDFVTLSKESQSTHR